MLPPLAGQIERYMTLVSARQKLTAANIANSDTPDYKTKDIDFQSELNDALTGPPHVTEVAGLATKNDGNNVSLDREARMLAENAIRFNAASQLLQGQIRMIRAAIQDGR
ncbi:MAG: flagellar basal body protein [Bryobacteraceae bacterium]